MPGSSRLAPLARRENAPPKQSPRKARARVEDSMKIMKTITSDVDVQAQDVAKSQHISVLKPC